MKYFIYTLLLFIAFPSFSQQTKPVRNIQVANQEQAFAWLMIRSDKLVDIYLNGTKAGELKPGEMIKIPAVKGDNLIQLKSKEGEVREKIVSLTNAAQGSNHMVDLYFIKEVRPAEGKERVLENMVFVEGGTFMMGNEEGRKNEKPVHEVTLRSFYISKHEVTVGEYRKYCEETGLQMPKEPNWGWNDEEPMVNITWYEARDYCLWAGGRLPTEAEWEYAAKGGKHNATSLYSGSDEVKKVAWTDANNSNKPLPVGSLEPNELGLYDMSGNVWEWIQDNYKGNYYKKSPEKNPAGPRKSPFRSLRGGSFGNKADRSQVTHRYSFSGKGYHKTFGFRVVVPVEE